VGDWFFFGFCFPGCSGVCLCVFSWTKTSSRSFRSSSFYLGGFSEALCGFLQDKRGFRDPFFGPGVGCDLNQRMRYMCFVYYTG
jgi:hypothetical protein